MSSATGLSQQSPPHVAILPSAEMGHLTPILRLAAMLVSRNCTVSLITAQPSVSAAEATHITAFLAAYPTINRIDLQILPHTPSDPDPFFVRFDAIIRSGHLLTSLLSATSPPISAIFSDIASVAGVCQVAEDLGIPFYIVSVTCARFSAFAAHFSNLIGSGNSIKLEETQTSIHVPGLIPFDISTLPPVLFIPNHIFTNCLIANSRVMSKAKGMLLNTFHGFEPETIEAVNSAGKVIPGCPPFLPIGPFEPHKLEVGDHRPLPWLHQQPPQSVVYVCFGSKNHVSRDQIRDLRDGLEGSGKKFLWVLRTKILDEEDDEKVEEILGESFIERTKEQGMVVKGWVNQEDVLSHPAIGLFLSHAGWNSVMEAAVRGIPMLAWPPLGDQKVNAGVMEAAGLGVWEKSWGWMGDKIVKGEEIAEKIRMVMSDEVLREKARKIAEEAKKAVEIGGSSNKVLMKIIEEIQHK